MKHDCWQKCRLCPREADRFVVYESASSGRIRSRYDGRAFAWCSDCFEGCALNEPILLEMEVSSEIFQVFQVMNS